MQTRLYGSGRPTSFLFFALMTSVKTFSLNITLPPRDEISLFAPDIPCGLSLRSHYVFIPVLSIHQRVFLQASVLATPQLIIRFTQTGPDLPVRSCFVMDTTIKLSILFK